MIFINSVHDCDASTKSSVSCLKKKSLCKASEINGQWACLRLFDKLFVENVKTKLTIIHLEKICGWATGRVLEAHWCSARRGLAA